VALGGIERLEKPVVVLGANTRSGVPDQHLDGPGLRRARGHRDVPFSRRRRDHRIHRVHDQVEQHLLQLDRIACRRGQHGRQIDFDASPAADQFAVEQSDRRIDETVDIDRLGPCLAFFQQIAKSENDLARAIVLVNDIPEGIADLDEVGRFLRE
jgi:hypothetical protein